MNKEGDLLQRQSTQLLLLDVSLNHCGLFIQFNLSTHARQTQILLPTYLPLPLLSLPQLYREKLKCHALTSPLGNVILAALVASHC